MTYPAEQLDRWRRACRIAAEARDRGAGWAVPGVRRRDLADRIEAFIRSKGAEPSFPANLSRDFEAAHYTPSPDDAEVLGEGDLLKVDVGAHLDGAIADTAITVEVGGGHRHDALIRAVREGLVAGIREVRAGVSVNRIGTAVQTAVHARGLKPVRNLMGHSIRPYVLHGGTSIPNVAGVSEERLAEGEIIAIEPFVTNGAGAIEDGPFGNIVRFRTEPPGTDPAAAIFRRYRTLPFTARWLTEDERVTLRRARKHLQVYPVFVESGDGWVAQAEHTVLVTADGGEVLTQWDGP
ncbi:MAG: type II methionyl aminopeptidase [Thermoplasmata archaeon]|nr:type II methionyl aminopeptidase [Thermoplasmata archaeon]